MRKQDSMIVMDKLARIFAIVLLAAFAMGTVAHAARATSMSLAMAVPAMADADMGDCDACPPDEGKTPICGQACLAPFVAIAATVGVELPFAASCIAGSVLKAPDGHVGSPDPSPPRTIFLN
jgi:hypothetical protein